MADTPLSPGEIAVAAFRAGFRGESLATAVAIALAESGGDPRSHNTVGRDNSYGLWQINMFGSLGPSRRSSFGLSSNDDLFDPTTNAKAAFEISGGGANFKPWSVYTSGAYRRHLGEAAQAATPKGFGDVVTGVVRQAGDTVGDQVQRAVGALAEPFIKGLTRLAIIGISVTAGVALVVAGAWRSVRAGG